MYFLFFFQYKLKVSVFLGEKRKKPCPFTRQDINLKKIRLYSFYKHKFNISIIILLFKYYQI